MLQVNLLKGALAALAAIEITNVRATVSQEDILSYP